MAETTTQEESLKRFDTNIDLNRLHFEWVDQPKRFREVAELLSEARRAVAIAKARLDVVIADTGRDVRENPTAYGYVKATEGIVEQAVILTPGHREATKSLINARYREDLLEGLLRAFDHRKSALENLVKLQLNQYFAAPHADAEDREAVHEFEKDVVRRPRARPMVEE